MSEQRKTKRCRTLGTLLSDMRLPEEIKSLEIGGICMDSRLIKEGDVFIAIEGARVNGKKFIPQAIQAGAAAVLVEGNRAGTVKRIQQVPQISVANLTSRVSEVAGACYGNPSFDIPVIGVTGTNGKSTCVSLIAQLHNLLKGRAATLGTLGVGVGENYSDLGMTTPDPVSCQKVLAEMRDEKFNLVAMEVSSHGLDQNRVAGISFDSAVFTNLTHDHLDYHSSLQHYANAKQKLFEMSGLNRAVINLDDPFAPQMLSAAKKHTEVLSYSLLHFVADVYATDIQYFNDGVSFHLVSPWGEAEVNSPLLGEFNVSNLLAAITVIAGRGAKLSSIVDVIKKLMPVPGRMERLKSSADIMVVVDYAHTPDALQHAIAAVRTHTAGKLWVVFGCGGDRDQTKRPTMARIAEKFADEVMVTSDNPREENPKKIIADICEGFEGKDYRTIVDRKQAIEYVITNATSQDVILLAGKGHESYQIIGQEKHPFSDVDVSLESLSKRSSTPFHEEQL